MGDLFAELKRRNIYRVAAAYAVVAWVVLQIVNNVAPAFNLPGSAVMLVIVLLTAGFPIALVFAWVLDLKAPEGAAPTRTGAMDGILAAVALVFVGMFAYQQVSPATGSRPTLQSTVPSGISIAVLPFANLSDDRQQEFFSDGMTDEIAGALAKVLDLRVIARSSAFQFKGQSPDVRMVGQALGASHLIEGSVRQAGERTRITAQLIRANDGVQLWSENYDRDLKDIFSTQEDIAQVIAGALRVPPRIAAG